MIQVNNIQKITPKLHLRLSLVALEIVAPVPCRHRPCQRWLLVSIHPRHQRFKVDRNILLEAWIVCFFYFLFIKRFDNISI